MWTTVFIISSILLTGNILRLLMLISTTMQLLSKDRSVLQQRLAAEKEYLFVKGLY